MNKIISIIIPAWHEEIVIKDTLQALKKLIYPLKKCEVIVVASSDDNTYKIAKEQNLSRFKRYLVLKQKPGGKNTALQQGVKESKGKFIVLLDADIIVDKNWLAQLIKPLMSSKVVCSNGNWFPLTKSWLNNYFMIEKVWSRQLRKGQSASGGGGIAFKRELIKDVGMDILFNKKVYAGVDHDFGEQILKKGYQIYFVEKAKTRIYFDRTLKGFIKDQLRWKDGYSKLITKKRFFAVLMFNLCIMVSSIVFLSIFINFKWLYFKIVFSLPFFVYFFCSFIQCSAVAKATSCSKFISYFPVYLFVSLIDRLLTCYAFLRIKRKKQVHFKGERIKCL